VDLTNHLINISKKYQKFTINQIIDDKIISENAKLIIDMLIVSGAIELKDDIYSITEDGINLIAYETENGEPAVESANNAAPNAAPLNAGLPPKIPD